MLVAYWRGVLLAQRTTIVLKQAKIKNRRFENILNAKLSL
jgi:hypothetical protein